MARVEVHPDRVVIRLTRAEKVTAMRRRDITLDRSAITSAVITADPWIWLRGVRSPGTHVPGTLAAGTWRSFAGADFVLAKKGRDAIVIDLEAGAASAEDRGWVGEYDAFSRVILSTTHAAELVHALRLADENAEITVDTE
ncbi:hypothetical protein [Leucobacter chromiireducens]|uniref:Uncharacterized protein n=1 Tax=Leucobacter chromiireducens subsp. solipictus TaxID=398235 RepID=A0ABS1SCZ4_9MICO|nr:hypothetical protein [Leucobacter chromiireducens]MBL3678415.1 hypothetical protein [Leucobacter chromiireducens subsp. solipictus]